MARKTTVSQDIAVVEGWSLRIARETICACPLDSTLDAGIPLIVLCALAGCERGGSRLIEIRCGLY